jgi:preprotein translocase subunit SecA
VASEGDLTRWTTIGRMALDLGEPMVMRSDAELSGARTALSEQWAAGQARELRVAEGLAAAAEAARRATGFACAERHLVAGAALSEGHAVELADGGANAIISVLPAFVSVVSGGGVHVVAADEHLAARGFQQTKSIFALLGVASSLAPPGAAALEDHQRAFDAEVTYGSCLQMAYQYLGNHLAQDRRELVRWAPQLAVVDQVDAILIDHADDPLVIRAPMQPDAERLGKLAVTAAELNRPADYDIDDTTGIVSWSSSGLPRAAALLQGEPLDSIGAALTRRYLEDAVRARHWYRRGADYAVEHGRIIVSPTPDGKLAQNPRLRNGVLQAIEAREGLPISAELVLLARITVCDYFRLYERLAGLSGEAARAAGQLERLYRLKVASPAEDAPSRVDHPDVHFDQASARLAALVSDAVARHQAGQPVVVGVQSDDDARLAIQMLKKSGVRQAVLLTDGGQQAASAFAAAGRAGAVTVLGPRVPRGYDIAIEAGQSPGDATDPQQGLAVLVAGRSRSRRSDRWLQGLAGRRGDPGESRFYLSAQDPLLAGLQSRVMTWIPAAIRQRADGGPVGAVQARVIADVQRKAEIAGFERLLDTLAFEEAESTQRREIYAIRDRILFNAEDYIGSLMDQLAMTYAQRYRDAGRLLKHLARLYPPELSDGNLARTLAGAQPADTAEIIKADIRSAYRRREEFVGSDALRDIEPRIALAVLGSNWRQQLRELESMAAACGFTQRARDHLPEYQAQATKLYRALRDRVTEDTLGYLFHADPAG